MKRPRSSTPKAAATHRLLHVMARVKVWELARLADMSVEQLIDAVVRASGLPAIPWPRSPRQPVAIRRDRNGQGGNRSIIAPTEHFTPPSRPPPLASMVGRSTLRELDAAVDYWVLATSLHEHAWNVNRTAMRLGMARRDLRARWTKLRSLPRKAPNPGRRGSSSDLPSFPEPPSLPGLLAGGATRAAIRDAVRQWFVTCTVAVAGGNRTHAASTLDVSRRRVREILASCSAERSTSASSMAGQALIVSPSSAAAEANTSRPNHPIVNADARERV